VRYAWIAQHKAHWPITLACEVLGVSPSGYFVHWRRKDTNKPSKPEVRKRISDEALLVHIKAIHAEVKQEYGWPKMWKELFARGIRVGKERQKTHAQSWHQGQRQEEICRDNRQQTQPSHCRKLT
jgi:putative transposase